MCDSFWTSVFANGLSDLVVGLILGGGLAWWVGNRLSSSERNRQLRDEQKARAENAVRYLELFHTEVENLVGDLPNLITTFEETGWGREIPLRTPLWDVMKPSGELPKLLHAEILECLTQFYEDIAYAKRGLDFLVESWLVPSRSTVPGMKEKQTAFMSMTSSSLKKAQSSGKHLLERLSSESRDLRTQLKT